MESELFLSHNSERTAETEAESASAALIETLRSALRQEREARQRAEKSCARLTSLQTITARASESLTPTQIADAVLAPAVMALHADGGVLALFSPTSALEVTYTVTSPSRWIVADFTNSPLFAGAAQSEEPLWLSLAPLQTMQDDTFLAALPPNCQTLLIVPLRFEGKRSGAFAFGFSSTPVFEEADRDFLLALAQQAAQALHRAERYADLMRQSVLNGRIEQSLRQSEARMRSELKAHQERMREAQQSRESYRALVEAVPQIAWITGADGSLLYINPQWTAYSGCTREETNERGWNSFLHPEDAPRTIQAGREAVEKNERYMVEYRLRGADGVYRWFLARELPLRDEREKVTKWYGTCTDIDERKGAEQLQRFLNELNNRLRVLTEPEAMLQTLVESVGSRLGVFRCTYAEIDADSDQLTVLADSRRGAESHVGLYSLSILGDPLVAELQAGRTVVIEDTRLDPRTASAFEMTYQPEKMHSLITVPMKKNERWASALSVIAAGARVWNPDEIVLLEKALEQAWLIVENTRLYQAAQKENATRKQAERERERTLAEIEKLNEQLRRNVRETHHRVKNNLQVISAMADIQVLRGLDRLPVEEFKRVIQHVRSLAVVHSLLTQEAKADQELTTISAQSTLEHLLPLLQTMTRGRRLSFEVEDMPLSLKHSTSLAMLVNELISNAVKHGSGDIHLSLMTNGDRANLTVYNRGTGFPAGFDPRKSGNTGMELIESVSGYDMGGTVEYINVPNGAEVRVTFPITTPL